MKYFVFIKDETWKHLPIIYSDKGAAEIAADCMDYKYGEHNVGIFSGSQSAADNFLIKLNGETT